MNPSARSAPSYGVTPDVGQKPAAERAVADFQEAVLSRLRERMSALASWEPILSSTSQVDLVVDRMLASLPGTSPLDQKIGPFYDTAGLAAWLGMSRQLIHSQMKTGKILGLKTTEGELVYPAFQFGPAGERLPRLPEVLKILASQLDDPWGNAIWLNTPVKKFDNHSAAELLRGGQAEQVLTAARRDVDRWAQ